MYTIACRVLIFDSIALIALGIYSILFNNTSLFSIINWIMDPNFWGNETLSSGTQKFKVFTWDYLGMFHTIWGLNIYYIVKYGLMKKREEWAWRSIAITVVVWLLVDVIFTLTIKRNTFLVGSIVSAIIFFILPLVIIKKGLKAQSSENIAVQNGNLT
jgi:hypothetical protein